MSKKNDCSLGTKWDPLTTDCVHDPQATKLLLKPATDPPRVVAVQLRTTLAAAQADPVVVQPAGLDNGLWVVVGLLTVGSILALVIWTIIYRQQIRHSIATEDPEPAVQPVAKAETPVKLHTVPVETNGHAELLQRAVEAPSCPHLDVWAQTGSRCEESFTTCRGPAKHAGMEGSGGLVTYNTMRQHRVPLPATELGGTALVTTKTV